MNLFKAYILAGIKFINFAEENIKEVEILIITDK